MSKGVTRLALGVFITALSLAMWRITGNFYAWLVIFLPGSFYTLLGLYGVFIRNDT